MLSKASEEATTLHGMSCDGTNPQSTSSEQRTRVFEALDLVRGYILLPLKAVVFPSTCAYC